MSALDEIFREEIEKFLQEASSRIGDLVESYPPERMVFVLATMQIFVSAVKPHLSDLDQLVFDHLLSHSAAIVAPSSLDPRKKEAEE